MEPILTAEGTLVRVPGMLRDCTGGATEVRVPGATLGAALAALADTYPLLRVHVWDEAGALRPHVLIFYNGISTRRLPDLARPLAPGDQLRIVQAVSGG